jgi:hypothetical protein
MTRALLQKAERPGVVFTRTLLEKSTRPEGAITAFTRHSMPCTLL